MIGPDTVTPLAGFITHDVNLFKYQFERVDVTPALSRLATRAYYESTNKWNFIRRVQLARWQALHDIAVRQRTETEPDDHFSFELAPLTSLETDNLKSIAMTIFHTTAFIIGRPRRLGSNTASHWA